MKKGGRGSRYLSSFVFFLGGGGGYGGGCEWIR